MRRAIVFTLACFATVLCAAEKDTKLTARQAQGRELYEATCVYCHGPTGWATKNLTKRLGESRALLASRADLNKDYIRYAVRHGIGSMPWYSRTDLSDSQIELIAEWLTRQ